MADKKLIKSFKTSQELDSAVASLLIEEFQKPGLILLPVGSTFESGIYPQVNEYFAYEEFVRRDTEDQGTSYTARHQQVDPGLKLSHLDELVNETPNIFANVLRRSLTNVVKQLGTEFHAIDVNDIESFDRFIKQGGGPRLIFLGIGADPALVHVAFIGEEFLNTSTTEIALSKSVAEDHRSTRAVTIGTDIFKLANLEKIIVVVKGKNKAQALAAGLKDPDTGLGFLVKNYSNKLVIYADEEALSF